MMPSIQRQRRAKCHGLLAQGYRLDLGTGWWLHHHRIKDCLMRSISRGIFMVPTIERKTKRQGLPTQVYPQGPGTGRWLHHRLTLGCRMWPISRGTFMVLTIQRKTKRRNRVVIFPAPPGMVEMRPRGSGSLCEGDGCRSRSGWSGMAHTLAHTSRDILKKYSTAPLYVLCK